MKATYKVNDIAVFKLKNQKPISGTIYIVDANGTFDCPEEPCYDIIGVDGVLYKHVKQSMLI